MHRDAAQLHIMVWDDSDLHRHRNSSINAMKLGFVGVKMDDLA